MQNDPKVQKIVNQYQVNQLLTSQQTSDLLGVPYMTLMSKDYRARIALNSHKVGRRRLFLAADLISVVNRTRQDSNKTDGQNGI